MGNLQLAYNLAVQLCNKVNPPCLYSMDVNSSGMNGLTRRCGGTYLTDNWYGSLGATRENPIQYFDCSGFISYILWKAGYSDHMLGFTTFYEKDYLSRMGFTIYNYSTSMPLKAGDIVWYNTINKYGERVGHTEMVYDGNKRWTMGAKGRGSAWGLAPTKNANDNVAIGEYNTDNYYSGNNGWQYLARDNNAGQITGQGLKWIYKNEYMSDDEIWNNAYIAGSILANNGYSMNAICGILGNMAAESGVQPWLTERGGGGGYGLVQWTPKSDLVDVVRQYNLGDYTSGDVQTIVFDYECGVKGTNIQWYDIYPHKPQQPFVPFAQWKVRADYPPEDMAYAFMSFYERPAWETCHLEWRTTWARKFFDRFSVSQFNGAYAFDTGYSGNQWVYLMDYVRRKNNLRIL